MSLGFDIGGTSLRAGVVEDGALLRTRKVPTPRTPAGVVEACAALAAELNAPSGPAGVGMAAMMPLPRRRIERAPNFDWDDVPFAELLEAALDREVHLLNDLEAILWGERAAGAAEGASEVLCVFLGTGMGAAAVTGGRLLLGSRGVAAEIGHMVVHESDALCGCGARGCVETVVGGRYLLEQAKALDPGATDLSPLAGEAGRETVALAAKLAARAIGAAVTILNPGLLVLGGGVLSALPQLERELKQQLVEVLSPASIAGLDIRAAVLGDDAGVIGAASWAETAQR